MHNRRGLVFGLLVVACTVIAAVAIVAGVRESDADKGGSDAARRLLPEARASDRPLVVFRDQDADQKARGQVALASTAGARAGRRTLAELSCDRVYFAAGEGVCLARGSGFASGYRAKVFDDQLRVRHELPVDGIPSRARVSPDGRYGSVTLFVTGHAYAEAGAFSTQTTLIDLERGEKLGDLEGFTVTRDGKQVTAADRNFWGVTFADDSDRFYATMATGGKTYLIQGSVGERTAHTIHENVECPSLSPDGTRIAYKKRTGSGDDLWHLTVLDLDTMREMPLAETRSVDDQVEWLDDERVLYGVDGDVWIVPADGSGKPRRFVSDASSPAVVRW